MGNFWLCQRWYKLMTSQGGWMIALWVAVTSLGGDFGISGEIQSAEKRWIGRAVESDVD